MRYGGDYDPYGREFLRGRRHRRSRPRPGWGGGYGGWPGRRPGRPAHGFPVRGIHSYDLDYGRQAGGPETDYSGRAGWPTGVREDVEPPPERRRWSYADRYEWPRRWRCREPEFEERHWAAVEPSPYARRGRGRRRRRS